MYTYKYQWIWTNGSMMVQMFKLGHYKSFKHDFRKLKEKRQFFFPKMDRPLFM